MFSPVILAGGYGKRLWPLSTREKPKPFALHDSNGHTLFQATVLRVVDRTRFLAPLVVCNVAHRALVLDQLQALGILDATLMLEPEARNTAPAIALAAMHCAQQAPEATMVVMPADHQIDAPEVLLAALEHADIAAQAGKIVTFAITPTSVETGFGYIQRGAVIVEDAGVYAIQRFIEKPEQEVAERLVESGEYGWNSGIFVMRPHCVLNEFECHASEILAACGEAYANCLIDGECVMPEAAAFARVRATPFDRAIMERTSHGAVMPLTMGWRDLGSWDALHQAAPVDAQGNAVTGNVVLKDVRGCYLYSDGAPIHAVGVEDMLVVAAHGQLLLAPRQRAGDIKEMQPTAILGAASAGVTHRAWGCFQIVETGAHYQVKQLTVRPRGKISLQRHTQRSEHWVVVRGVAQVTRGQEQFMLYENQSTFIPAGEIHRLENPVDEPLIIIEVQTGSYLGEDDIERFEDISAHTVSA